MKEGPNHYEVLGLTPSATGDEIAKAFTTRMQSHITNPGEKVDAYALKLRAAYKTLGDPFWRRIYDAELGLAPVPQHAPSRHPDSADEQREAPFIAGNGPRYSTETSAPDERGRWSNWNRRRAAMGAAVGGLGLVILLIGLWGNFDRTSTASRGRTTVGVEQSSSPSRTVTQTAPQPAASIEAEWPGLPRGTAAIAPAPVKPADVGPLLEGDSLAMGGAAQAPTADGVAEAQVAKQPESTTVASSADPVAPASPSDSPTATPDTVAAVAQAVSPAPDVRPAPVVNRAAPPR